MVHILKKKVLKKSQRIKGLRKAKHEAGKIPEVGEILGGSQETKLNKTELGLALQSEEKASMQVWSYENSLIYMKEEFIYVSVEICGKAAQQSRAVST